MAAIRRALSNQRFQAPEGEVRVDPETQHLWKTARVARLTSKGTAEVVWSSAESIRPVPFPASRSRGQWESFLADLQQSSTGGRPIKLPPSQLYSPDLQLYPPGNFSGRYVVSRPV